MVKWQGHIVLGLGGKVRRLVVQGADSSSISFLVDSNNCFMTRKS